MRHELAVKEQAPLWMLMRSNGQSHGERKAVKYAVATLMTKLLIAVTKTSVADFHQ
jgi:hypothetical protein